MTEMKIVLSIEEAADYMGIGRKVLIKNDILEKFMEMNEGKNLWDKKDVKAVTRKSPV